MFFIFIGVALAAEMSSIATVQAQGAATVRVDLRLAWRLVARAMRWTGALQARLAAEAKAAKEEHDPVERLLDRPERLDDPPEWLETWAVPMVVPRPQPTRKPEPDDCIDGMPVAEVVGQICADLDAAARVLGHTEAVRLIAMIAETAQALLAAPAGATTARPVSRAPDGVPAELGLATIPFAATPAPSPDTG
jgi:hypothetical protein